MRQENELAPTEGEPAPTDTDAALRARRTLTACLWVLAYQGFTTTINGVGAPWIATSFELDQSGIAALFARISLSAIGSLLLSRLADRVGRRRVVLGCLTATPLCALGAALSTRLTLFALWEILLFAFIGATMAGAIVMLAEELPIAQRAKGQGYGGIAMGLGSGVCVIVMPLLVDAGWSWRWLLVIAAAGLLGVPFVARTLPESQRWQRAAASGATQRVGFSAVLGVVHRRRTLPMLLCVFLGTLSGAAAMSWTYFHAVSVVGLSADAASMMVIIAGGIGMIGFPLGAWTCERLGRVPTVVGSSGLVALGTLWFYWGPPAWVTWPAWWLGAAYCGFSIGVNAATVGGNSAATELFPTALRGTMIGWFALINALATVSAQGAIALLAAPLGGLSIVVGYLGVLAIPNAILFGLFIDETRGLSLEAAAREHA